MPDPSEPVTSSPPNSRKAKRRTKSSRIKPPRLLLITDLSHAAGRQLLASVDDQMQIRLPDWRLSVRDRRDADLTAATRPESLNFDASVLDSGSATVTLHHSGRPDTDFPINQRLAGSLLADVLLRRGFQHFRWASGEFEQLPKDSEFALGFHDEMQNADLDLDGHFHSATTPTDTHFPTIAAAIDPQSPAVVIAGLNARPSSSDTPPRLGVAPSAHWLATAALDHLSTNLTAATSVSLSPVLIPPVLANSSGDIAGLPKNFSDPLIADVSDRIDEFLIQHRATDAAELSVEFTTARRTLERRFREQLRTSIHREITRRQIAAARNHLLLPDVTPSQAATFSGYPTTRMLSINFQKLHKLSPRAYQRQHLGTWM
jgi:AraC-like DNA-binding protein